MNTFLRLGQPVEASLLARAFAATSRVSLITDAQENILHVSDAFTAITGYRAEEILGTNCRLLQGPGTDPTARVAIRSALRGGDSFEGDILNYRKDGSPFWNGLSITALRDEGGAVTHFVSVQRDINTRMALQEQLRFQATHDPVTGLPNRRALEEHLAAAQAAPRGDRSAALGVIDIDDFRLVNNRFGSLGGDDLLRQFGRRLGALLGEDDFLARLNGDEFVVVVDEIDDEDQLNRVLAGLHRAVETPFVIEGAPVSVGFSMGVALCPRDGTDCATLLREADAALYEAKAGKGDREKWWRSARPRQAPGTAPAQSVDRETRAQGTLTDDLARAYRERLFGGGLRMYMQPILDLRSGALSHVEALARLVLDDGTVVPPDVFLPGLSDVDEDELFRLALGEALGSLAGWEGQGLVTRVSVNLAPSTLLNLDCPDWVGTLLALHGIAPERLELELLETQTMDSAVQANAVDRLKALGVRLALDDLGSGYGSLKRLSDLPFDSIKLDRDLLLEIDAKPIESLSLIATLTQLGRDFGVRVVVEGLESAGVAEAAAVLGASAGQGYYFSAPMPAEAVPDWVTGFRSPLVPDAVRTGLGALAYHWQFLRWGSPHPHTLADCPVTGYLAAHPAAAGDQIHRHAQLHEGVTAHPAAGRFLQDWLAEQAQAEAAGRSRP
ncbi:diguanylate cyclase (GGDEF)-like protein/PAS domain S-box-containing protein [Cryobacterium sp. MP_M5]|uniref:putative bifunctional diguanylate cyclase/phosphodiesterase n=1 Tax=unclassified Cryobacterium TaxID=2649013 RepID=UPI0018CB4220|nr:MULTISPECIES: EAL domain-containing protein [unclassified Cryobacterium]MBG6059272.1 diguanylate cyclase (GGDEF)-like protein/PAS domain S-box-containing protein [Cryobacterium sp. MP_M3]MEC5177880.1 diguanylate cyclase (GGDEF)-like protein/PAS domain S-box-containing protein [Cryobacterium sp. MP_M5]